MHAFTIFAPHCFIVLVWVEMSHISVRASANSLITICRVIEIECAAHSFAQVG
jgi:hypothetical protein